MDRFSIEELESLASAYDHKFVFAGLTELDTEMHKMIYQRLQSRRSKTV